MVGLSDGEIGIWRGDEHLGVLRGHSKLPTIGILGEARLVSSAADGFVRHWDLPRMTCLDSSFSLDQMTGPRQSPRSFAPSVCCFGERAFLTTRRGGVDLWSADRQGMLRAQPVPGAAEAAALAVDGDGPLFATAGWSLQLWDLRKLKEPVATDPHAAVALCFIEGPGGRCIVSAGEVLRLWNFSLEQVWEENYASHTSAFRAEAYSAVTTPVACGIGPRWRSTREPLGRVVYASTPRKIFAWGIEAEGLRLLRSVAVHRTSPLRLGAGGAPLPREASFSWGPDEEMELRRSSEASRASSGISAREAFSPRPLWQVRSRCRPQSALPGPTATAGELPQLRSLRVVQEGLSRDAAKHGTARMSVTA